MSKLRFLLLLGTLVFLPQILCAREAAPTWYTRVWQTEDGLPSANVTAVAQTKNGFLWLATQSGLARFDGTKIIPVPIPLGRTLFIRTMLCDSSERFWLGEDGGVLIGLTPTNATMLTVSNGLPDSTPVQIVETGIHHLWVAYSDFSLCRISPSNVVTRFTGDAALPTNGVAALAIDTQGLLWFAKDGWVGTFNGDNFERLFPTDHGAQILPSRSGGIWVATPAGLLKYRRDGQSNEVANFGEQANHLHISALFEDSAGRVWIGTAADGLWLYEGAALHQIATSQNNIRAIMEDREGSLWVGTDGGGLNRLRQRVIELMGRSQGLPFETVRSLCEDGRGDLWVATQDGALTALQSDGWSKVETNLNWYGGLAHCVIADQAGGVWIGTNRRGLYHWTNGHFKSLSRRDGLAGTSVRSLLVSRNGDLWIGLELGSVVQRYRNGAFESFDLPGGSRAVRAMVEDYAGQVWMGTIDGRLFRWSKGVLADVTAETKKPYHPIRCLGALPDGSVWIGYAVGGLGRFQNGHFSQILDDQGLHDNNICAFMPDDHGRVWLSADRGLFSVSVAELTAAADSTQNHLTSVIYGRDDGLPGLQGYYGYSPGPLKTRSGDILFPTHSGIAVVHPERVHPNRIPPVVLIDKITAGEHSVTTWDAESNPKFSPGLRNLEFAFTAPSFIAPEQIDFFYRLDGWDDAWVDAGRNRRADYARLPPGNYLFNVRARNNSGVWSENHASFRFTIEPFFWQSAYFDITAGMLVILGLMLLVRHFSLRRARAMLRQVEQVAALQNERARIAQDMHDDLGAQFTQISLLGELARNAAAQKEKSGEYLEKLSAVARSGVKSLDEIVWAVNPRNDTLPDLLDYAGQFALNFLSAAHVDCRLDFPDAAPPRQLSGDLRHAIFLIIKEALNNVVRHARAQRVRLFFDCDDTEMRWSIEDNGQGFAKSPDDALADGLRNMKNRAAALGGKLTVTSAPGCGTKIRLSIPWHE